MCFKCITINISMLHSVCAQIFLCLSCTDPLPTANRFRGKGLETCYKMACTATTPKTIKFLQACQYTALYIGTFILMLILKNFVGRVRQSGCGPSYLVCLCIILQAFSFLAAILMLFSVIWDAMYLCKEWNDKVVKYTIKEAILG